MSDKIFIVDFEDSFTFNLANVLYPYESRLRVVPHSKFFNDEYVSISKTSERIAVVLGPGPGRPEEYSAYFNKINHLRLNSDIYIMGVCLGHQILGLMDGLIIQDASKKVHGQTQEVLIEGSSRIIQRYNSLSVYEDGVELYYRIFNRGISYQFHPESVGTENSIQYFKSLLEFIRLS